MASRIAIGAALLAAALLAGCAGPRAARPSAEMTGATAAPAVAPDEPVEGRIPDGINPLTKEQEDAVNRAN